MNPQNRTKTKFTNQKMRILPNTNYQQSMKPMNLKIWTNFKNSTNLTLIRINTRNNFKSPCEIKKKKSQVFNTKFSNNK